jgi:hypothetical protein
MKSVLKIIAVLILFAAASCADANKTSPDIQTTVIDQTVLDSATVLVIDSADQRFAHIVNSNQMLVYQDSLLIVSHSYQTYGEPIISLYDRGNPLRRLAHYIPRGSDTDEMVACRIHIAGDELFVSDSYYTHRYCAIPLNNLPSADELHLSPSGVEERGVAITPFRDGLLVENPQCYTNDSAGIRNDVPRLLHYRNGRCLTPLETVAYQVADINTGADIHYSAAHGRICFVSHRQPLVELYDDDMHLLHTLTAPSEGSAVKISIGKPQTIMHQQRRHGEEGPGIKATFDQTRRVVGASNQFHAFLCSAADDEHIYLAYCGRMFAHDYHTYPTHILVLDWSGNLVATYRFNRWIQAISPSQTPGTFYLTVYADDDCSSARMKLVKVILASQATRGRAPRPIEETDSLKNNKD